MLPMLILLAACSGAPGPGPTAAPTSPAVEEPAPAAVTTRAALEAALPEVVVQGTLRSLQREAHNWGGEAFVLELEDALLVMETGVGALVTDVRALEGDTPGAAVTLRGRLAPVHFMTRAVVTELSDTSPRRPLLALRGAAPAPDAEASALRTGQALRQALSAAPLAVEGVLLQLRPAGADGATTHGIRLGGELLTVRVVAEAAAETDALLGQTVRAEGSLRVDPDLSEFVSTDEVEGARRLSTVFLAQPTLTPLDGLR